MIFDNKINHEYCYDNYIYNRRKSEQISVFGTYDITAKLGIMYPYIPKYSDLLFLSEHQKLLARNSSRGPKIAAKQIYVYNEALNNFALQIWLNNKLINLKFPIT